VPPSIALQAADEARATDQALAAGRASLEVENLSKSFGGTPVVDDVGFTLPSGRFLTILGPSGCGKTTLLKMIAGFAAPDRGEIRIGARSLSETPPHRRSIGMVFQRLALFPHLTVRENVAYPLRMRRFPKAEIPERVRRYLEIVKLAGFERRYPHELSGGQQQRVAIARALVFEPQLLLLDEPLSSLDRKLREEMQEEFKRIQGLLGVTTVNVTHDQKEALLLSDLLIVMRAGRIEQSGPPREVYRRPASLFVADFLGASNRLAGIVVDRDASVAWVRVGSVLLQVDTAGADWALGEPVVAIVRAEQVRLGEPSEACDNSFDGHVTAVSFEGDRSICTLSSPTLPGAVRALVDERENRIPISVGDAVRFGWPREAGRAFRDDATQGRASRV